ncbi:MAG: SpoIIE family protein phosphatase [Alkalispirochaeta sp.]
MDDITKAVSSDIYGLIVKPWDVDRLTAELDRMVTRVRGERRRDRREYELESQLKIAGEFQYRLFERAVPVTASFDIEVSNRPAPGIYVTGEYYEVIPLSDTHVLFLLGDAAGHGVKSAFVATTVKAIIDDSMDRILAEDFEIGRFLSELNARVMERLSGASEVLVSFSAALLRASRE